MRLVNCQDVEQAFKKRISKEGSFTHHLSRHEPDGSARH
jgi:hypothetical protein